MRFLTTLTGLVLLIATSFSSLKAQPIDVNFNTTLRSRYVASTGFDFEDVPVMQNSVILSKKGFYGLFWFNTNLDKKKLTEIDYFFGYSKSIGDYVLDASYGLFDLRKRGRNDLDYNFHEIWFSITRPGDLTLKFLNVQSVNGDGLENGNGGYFDFSADWQNIVAGNIQYNNGYYLDNPGFSFANLGIGYPIKFKNVKLKPEIRYQKRFKKEFVEGIEARLSVNF